MCDQSYNFTAQCLLYRGKVRLNYQTPTIRNAMGNQFDMMAMWGGGGYLAWGGGGECEVFSILVQQIIRVVEYMYSGN